MLRGLDAELRWTDLTEKQRQHLANIDRGKDVASSIGQMFDQWKKDVQQGTNNGPDASGGASDQSSALGEAIAAVLQRVLDNKVLKKKEQRAKAEQRLKEIQGALSARSGTDPKRYR